ncbi:hypothetical protein Rt10032_c10g4069 [Rhodotorula toruloides]|uniref:Uncharacterized protein n=1 Tax=Rhodotorula toruloides TaxID=5286 RepID=A0A511KI46_RHOTO|nr:hypothetical protein Rt10032_c10g4069 [Rhodotorula toruloides]
MAEPLHAQAAAELAAEPVLAAAIPREPSRQRPAHSATLTVSPSSTTAGRVDGAVPLRIPAILRLQESKGGSALQKKERTAREGADPVPRKGGGTAPGGKRRRRRWENAQLAGNPHLHRPSRADFSPGPYMKDLSTTFTPPPAHFSRSTYVSSSPASSPSAASLASNADHGQFSMSLRGLRRNLRLAVGPRAQRGQGGRTEEVLDTMERELKDWLMLSGRIPEGFYHDSMPLAGDTLIQTIHRGQLLDATALDDYTLPTPGALDSLPDLPTRTPAFATCDLPDVPTLTELTRQPHTLIWLAPSPHHRFLLHSLVRYYNLTSFSRPLNPLEPDVRVTHVLRPQLARPRCVPVAVPSVDARAWDTPPGTDWSGAGETTTEVEEFTAGEEIDTDAGSIFGGLVSDRDEWETLSTGQPVVGGTDDEAEVVYSSATDSEDGLERSEDDDYEAEDAAQNGGVDSLAASFADLSTGPAAPATPSSRSGVGTPSPAFTPFVPVSSPTGSATPLAPAPPRPAFSPFPPSSLTTPTRPIARARGRRSLPGPVLDGYTSAESSPSRSPTRATKGGTNGISSTGRNAFVGAGLADWELPERDFVDWLLD